MKAGFIAVVGRPNVGKSTLINKLVAEKVAIVSDKAGTTRDNIKGILNFGDNQYIFIDTPGIHKPKHLLGEHMTNSAIRVLKEVDVIVFLLDGSQEISTGDQFVMDKVSEAKRTPKVLVINKIDKMDDYEMKAKRNEIREKLGEFDAIVEISGQYALGIPKLLSAIDPFLEEGIKYYPDDMYTDMPIYRIITEVVREKILNKTRDEIPHSVAIEILNVERRSEGKAKDKFDINIYVERDSQKGIIIGKNGALLKDIGTEARKDIEQLLGQKIFLNLWVKVKDDWRKKKPFLKEMGYHIEK
ncbi:MAG: GTPase Era [Fusobacteriaceae bacterium]